MRSRILPLIALVALGGCGQSTATANLPGKIAFVSNRFERKPNDPSSTVGISVFEKGRVHNVFQSGDHPKWSRDGKRIFCKKSSNVTYGPIVEISYPEGKVLREFDLAHNAGRFAILPDESGLIYEGWDGESGKTPRSLFEHRFATGEEKELIHISSGPMSGLRQIDVSSKDGRWVVFDKNPSKLEARGETGVYLLDRQSGKAEKILFGQHARFAPDGKIVFTTHRKGAQPDGEHMKTSDVFIYDLISKQLMRLTENEREALEDHPVFSPDGRYATYVTHVFSGGERAPGLYVINADGTNERLLLGHDGYGYQSPDWGP